MLYRQYLLLWNKRINLTAITDPEEILIKHFVDSLACFKALTPLHEGASLLDVGTGAGFPGLPLKIAHPRLSLTLLEPSRKKVAFLQHLVGTLRLEHVTIIAKPLEDVSRAGRFTGSYRFVVTRALNLFSQLANVVPLLERGGKLILCRSRSLSPSDPTDGFKVDREILYDLPADYGKRVLVVLSPIPNEMFHVEHSGERPL